MFPDDAAAEKWFEEERWGKTVDGLPESIYCPHNGCCGRITLRRKRRNRPYWCGECRSHFSVRTEWVMSHSKVPYQKWAIAVHLHLSRPQGINACQLARDIGVTHKTAWSMLHRIREAWGEPEPLNSSDLEMDEAFYGGKDRNRHYNKQYGDNWQKGVSIGVVVYCRDTGRVALKVTPDRKRETLRPIVEEHLLPGDSLNTDEFSAYSDFGVAGRHQSVNHKQGEYVRDGAGTNRAESFNALAKRTVRDTYRHVSPKYLPRYFNEISGRFNIRHLDSEEQMRYLTARMMRKRLTYRDLLATEVPPVPYTHHRWKEGEPFRKVSKVKTPGSSC